MMNMKLLVVVTPLSICHYERERPDTCKDIVFMTTRVQARDKDEWYKLVHLMQYIRGMHEIYRTLSTNGSEHFKWWVDALFAVHNNM